MPPNSPVPVGGFQVPTQDFFDDFTNTHVPVTFTLPNGQIISFQLNPTQVQEIIQPVETEVPTIAGWFTFRWLIAPRQWVLQLYSGLQGVGPATGTGVSNTGSSVPGGHSAGFNQLINNLIGQTDILFTYPFLGLAVKVKVMTVQRQYSGSSPYTTTATVQLRENIPLVLITSGAITQFTNTVSAVASSPTGNNFGGRNVAYIPASPSMTSWDSVLQAIGSHTNVSDPHTMIINMNSSHYGNVTFSQNGTSLPLDTNGNKIQQFLYDPGTVGTPG